MNQYVYEVEEGKGLSEVISQFQRARKKEDRHLLISIFHGSNDRKIIAEDLALLKEAFPGAEIAGMSSSGGIMDGHMVIGHTVVSFSAFEDTEVKVFTYDISAMTPAKAGEKALETFRQIPHLSGVEVFTTLSTVNVDDFLTALDNLPPSVAVFGGGADTYAGGDDTCVFGNDFISRKAIVAVCFAGKVKIRVYQNLGWQPLGKAMTITATDGDKVIRELDGKPAIHVYEKYLKIKKSDFGGQQLMSFPLLILRNGRMLARLPAACREDGSLVMSANCFAGEEARLAYGDPNEIIERCQANTKEIRQFSPEGITIFSCITRRLFLKEDTNQVLAPYGEIAPRLRRLRPRGNQPAPWKDGGPQHDPGGSGVPRKGRKWRQRQGSVVHRFPERLHDHHPAAGLLHHRFHGGIGKNQCPPGGGQPEALLCSCPRRSHRPSEPGKHRVHPAPPGTGKKERQNRFFRHYDRSG